MLAVKKKKRTIVGVPGNVPKSTNVREPTYTPSFTSGGAEKQIMFALRVLQERYFHPPRKPTAEQREEFWLAQCEMFTLANALVAIVNPELQYVIDVRRARIMHQMKELPPALGASGAAGAYVMRRTNTKKRTEKKYYARPLLWQDIDITPEVACDPTLTGSGALASDVRLLRASLREQRALVSRLLSART